jgi:SprT protein
VQLSEVERLADRLMRQHGLAHWSFAFNRRKRSLGLCRYTLKRLELSRHFAEAHEEPEIRDVILHEIAHALAGHVAAHGPRWKAICKEIGATPERCGEARMPAGRWIANCAGCGQEYGRYRRPMRNRRYSCPHCGPKKGELRFRTMRPRA